MHCVSCNKEGLFVCDACFAKIQLLDFQVCPKCEKLMTENGKLCEACKKQRPALDALVVATKYKDGHISKLVHLLKYNFVEDLHAPLGQLLVQIILKNNLPLPDIIVPVPLHKRRLRWRGFNQSELLAKYVSINLTPGFSIPVLPDLILRRKYTPPQMQIGKYSERRKNMIEAFAINANQGSTLAAAAKVEPLLQGKKILLIDDIATTGATLNECAKVLKASGAKKVFGAVIARQEFKR